MSPPHLLWLGNYAKSFAVRKGERSEISPYTGRVEVVSRGNNGASAVRDQVLRRTITGFKGSVQHVLHERYNNVYRNDILPYRG